MKQRVILSLEIDLDAVDTLATKHDTNYRRALNAIIQRTLDKAASQISVQEDNLRDEADEMNLARYMFYTSSGIDGVVRTIDKTSRAAAKLAE